MTTQLLYQTDSYLAETTATVVAVDGQAVALDRTIFYPGGGGQVPDTGALVAHGSELAGDGGQEEGRRDLAYGAGCAAGPWAPRSNADWTGRIVTR